MSSVFHRRVLAYCLGRGTLSLRGAKRRPWLEIIRPETERTYLDHQVRTLRRLHGGALEVVWDRLPGKDFYDLERIRVQSDKLWRPYELLYPRDRANWTLELLDLLGLEALSALWCDYGQRKPDTAFVRFQAPELSHEDLTLWMGELNLPGVAMAVGTNTRRLCWRGQDSIKRLSSALMPLVHPTQRYRLKPPRNCARRYAQTLDE